MSLVNRNKIRRLVLKEFKMMGMADLGHGGLKPMGMTSSSEGCSSCGSSPCGCDDYDDMGEDFLTPQHSMQSSMGHAHKGGVSREDCCSAVMALIECCECPITKQALMECCQDILSGQHDR